MGLFLQAAIMPECKEADARAAVKAVAEKASIAKYLVRWSAEAVDEKAYEDDEFGYEDWQMADFMRRLGYPYEFGVES